MIKNILNCSFILLVTIIMHGCTAQPYLNVSSTSLPQMRVSAPGTNVTGTYRKHYILGFPTTDTNNGLEMALKDALSKAPQATTLINVFVETKITWFLFITAEDYIVTGLPVEFENIDSTSKIEKTPEGLSDFCMQIKKSGYTDMEEYFATFSEPIKQSILNDLIYNIQIIEKPKYYGPFEKAKIQLRNRTGSSCSDDQIKWFAGKINPHYKDFELIRE